MSLACERLADGHHALRARLQTLEDRLTPILSSPCPAAPMDGPRPFESSLASSIEAGAVDAWAIVAHVETLLARVQV